MKTFYVQQHIFTWGDKFSIYDAQGNERYYVEGQVFTFGKKLHLYNSSEIEVAYIEQKLLSFLPKYTIYKQGCEFAQIVKEFTFFHQEYSVSPLMWHIQGDFFAHSYEINDGSRIIASVDKQWFTLGDAYEISICDDVDEVAALSAVIVVDACIDNQND